MTPLLPYPALHFSDAVTPRVYAGHFDLVPEQLQSLESKPGNRHISGTPESPIEPRTNYTPVRFKPVVIPHSLSAKSRTPYRNVKLDYLLRSFQSLTIYANQKNTEDPPCAYLDLQIRKN